MDSNILYSDGYGSFPLVTESQEDGLLVIGATLAVDRLIAAYSQGIFPWYNEDDPICWYAPPERFVLFPSELIISKSMRTFMRNTAWVIKHNTAFREVMECCASIPRAGQDGTWIHPEMIEAYISMHQLGYAQSVEVWDGDNLVGGLYGIIIGKVFCGESMFSKKSNASKFALIHLCNEGGFELVDCQIYSSHLASLGAKLIPRNTFQKILEKNRKKS